jgi:uncharacterized membrane protein SirB2
MTYTLLKHLHVTSVIISLALFVLRGAWTFADSPRARARWTRIVPHVNDSVLLAAAIGMLVTTWGNPLQHPWITAKIVGLLAYIGLGSIALKRGRDRSTRIKAFIAALGVYAFIVGAAISKNAMPGLG